MPSLSKSHELAGQAIVALAGRTVSVAESLTGGLISAAITEIPGASSVFRGAVISYATDIKVSVLHVDEQLIARGGVVQAQVALEMAIGVCQSLDTDFGLAVTGVAGPAAQDGVRPGTVFLAVVQRGGTGSILRSMIQELMISTDGVAPDAARAYIRNQTVENALELLNSMASEAVSE